MTARAWAALTTVYVVWGSTYLAIMVAIRTLPPLLMSSARFLVAGGILYAFALRRGAARPTVRHWRSAAVAGAALLVVGNGGVAWSEQRIDSGVAALLIATMPLWIALFDRVFAGRRLSRSSVLGLVVGLGRVARRGRVPRRRRLDRGLQRVRLAPQVGSDLDRVDVRVRESGHSRCARRRLPGRAPRAPNVRRRRGDHRVRRADRHGPPRPS